MSGRRRRGAGGAALSPRGVAGAAVLVIVLAAAAILLLIFGPGPKAASGSSTTVILEHGAGVRGIARSLKQAHVIRSRTAFMAMAELAGRGRLKAGEYAIASGESLAQIVGDLRAGRVVRHFITIPEGWTSEMAANEVNASPILTGFAPTPPEGAILPETYEVQRGEERGRVMQRMERARDKLLAEAWAKREPGLPFSSPEEAVTLASIVEKETALPSERPRIAAVFENRLRAGMRLESDPTVIYGLSKGLPLGRSLSIGDLASPSPYNTYQVAGLPPTPIANPGRASLEAVLNPPKTDELYFVANGSGGHSFSSTYEQHEKNVARWREIERQRAAAGSVK